MRTLANAERVNLLTNLDGKQFSIVFELNLHSKIVVDISCFCFANDGLFLTDDFMVFYNQSVAPDGSIEYIKNSDQTSHEFRFDLSKLKKEIVDIHFYATIDGAGSLSDIASIKVSLIECGKTRFRSNFGKKIIDEGSTAKLAEIRQTLKQLNYKPDFISTSEGDLSMYVELYSREANSNSSALTTENQKPESKKTSEADEVRKIKEFQSKIYPIFEKSKITKKDIVALTNFCEEIDLNIETAMNSCKREVNKFMEFLLLSISYEHAATDKARSNIEELCVFLRPSKRIIDDAKRLFKSIAESAEIRKRPQTSIKVKGIITKNTELVFFHQKNVFVPTGEDDDENLYGHAGEVFVTNERIIFKSEDHVINIPLQGIISVDLDNSFVIIKSKTAKSSCDFCTVDACILEAHIDVTLKHFHRKADILHSSKTNRHMSQATMSAVWQRCNGQCVECGAVRPLEFDHIIPISKGGSNSEQNLQILCRECNLAKRDRI